ncbi:hypothetical protein [Maricaulis salignorans]|uniref:Uncharacterized protein n=1 Tax=Maricaulis salignorans TaxID=144026 RepID=A0A1G9PCS1_9PROT|nr:hypothetical protein [Maricaulis salignorans]SDL96353.1 hypothetical protein SAMN04488568_103182 [Maricaulis salignorans]
MRYLPTAFAQLAFAWKLYNYALDGNIDFGKLDIPVTFQEDGQILVLPDRIFDNENDFILAFQNQLCVAFGAAAITLNRSREEAGITLPDPIQSEQDQCVALTYQIRNAFAHDISEPKWDLRKKRYAREYEFGGIRVDLRNVGDKAFEYQDIGGPDVLFRIREYAEASLFAELR